MSRIDPQQERARLVETYSRQTDAELVEVAAQAYELTDVARTALRAELTKRGLSAPAVEYPPGDELEMRPQGYDPRVPGPAGGIAGEGQSRLSRH